jgi:murein DD-endopeptidase MepM/ murein hydrolase activator NlpD
MRSRRYTVVIADRRTGILRRCTINLQATIAVTATIFALPVLIGLGARWSGKIELNQLRTSNQALEVENASYRATTGELSGQIQSLQAVMSDLGARSALDPASRHAIEKLPAIVKSRAVGGAGLTTSRSLLTSSLTSPEDTFGMLRELLGGLESRLRILGKDVEGREKLAAATPSIWPAHGWLSASYGQRLDPFTGEPEYHPGLDISADKGQKVYATAAGRVESAGANGSYGNMVVLNHGFGLTTRYGHLHSFAVKTGDHVKRGDVIGYVGATGRATGYHLHYEVLANGEFLNPLRLLTQPPTQ